MKAAVFSTKPYDRTFLDAANTAAGKPHELAFFDAHLEVSTATLAQGATAVCPFVNDTVDAAVLQQLSELGVRLVALRGAGFPAHRAGTAGAVETPAVPVFGRRL